MMLDIAKIKQTTEEAWIGNANLFSVKMDSAIEKASKEGLRAASQPATYCFDLEALASRYRESGFKVCHGTQSNSWSGTTYFIVSW